MRREKLFDVLENIDEKYTDEAVKSKEEGVKRAEASSSEVKPFFSKRTAWIAAAASIVLIVIVTSAAVAIKAEETEYNKAMSFFEENDLSVEGLSRAEIKAVYRDIINNRFENDKTAEVIRKNIPGYEISSEKPTAAELAEAWENRIWVGIKDESEYTYKMDFVIGDDEEVGFGQVIQKTVVTCLKNGEKLWTVDIEHMWVTQGKILHGSFGTLLWETFRIADGPSNIRYYYKMVCVGDDGIIKWDKLFEHGSAERIYNVLERDDGTIAVFSTHYEKTIPDDVPPAETQEYLCVCILDSKGNELSTVSNAIGKVHSARIGSVTVCDNGYLVSMTNMEGGKTALFRTGTDGKVLGQYGYESGDSEYDIVDQIEYEGKLYISAYSYPKTSEKDGVYGKFAAMQEYVFSVTKGKTLDEIYEIINTDEYLAGSLEVARKTFTAVLLICDKDGGEPSAFYSINGAMGSKLSINEEGQLEWLTIDLLRAEMSVIYNSWFARTWGAVCRNVFDPDGKLIKQEDTGKLDGYEW
jgi:hypothetical protein